MDRRPNASGRPLAWRSCRHAGAPPSAGTAWLALLGAAVLVACSGDETTGGGSGAAGATGGGGGTAGSAAGGGGGEDTVTVEPTESPELFANPAMGWQTFHTYADVDPDLAGLPSGSAYFRWTWRALEPSDGQLDLDLVANALDHARSAGQTLMFRIMLAGSDSEYSPDWLGATGCAILTYQVDSGPVLHTPDLDDPACQTRHTALIEALGAAFADEPDLQIDIGSVGLWGEWHFSSTTPAVPMPSLATRQGIVDLYRSTFPNQPQMALIGDVEALSYATASGSGWRADCLGDLGFFSPTWNHMDDMYQQHVAEAGATEAWTHGPVAWESCHTMQQWVDAGYDVDYIFQYALDMHGSFVNNKSAALPPGAEHRQQVEELLARLGYRLALRSLSHPRAARPGEAIAVAMSWENLGVAPPYHPFELALRLDPADASPGGPDAVVISCAADVRTWVPGTTVVAETLDLPASLSPGTWTMSVGITGTPGIPMLNLAITGRGADGWYPVSTLEVE